MGNWNFGWYLESNLLPLLESCALSKTVSELSTSTASSAPRYERLYSALRMCLQIILKLALPSQEEADENESSCQVDFVCFLFAWLMDMSQFE